MRKPRLSRQSRVHALTAVTFLFLCTVGRTQGGVSTAENQDQRSPRSGRYLFEQETFGGNGRTCVTCHSRDTGTVSPEDAAARFSGDSGDPLFLGDGSNDGEGTGVSRMLDDATVLVRIPLPANVRLAQNPDASSVVFPRGIPTTLNTPALDLVLMSDGRESGLETQARGAILGHAAATRTPTVRELRTIADFERTRPFFSSSKLWDFAERDVPPSLPPGQTESERRGRRFFEDAPLGGGDSKTGLCSLCHGGPMLNERNRFAGSAAFVNHSRFQNIRVSEFNRAQNPVGSFVFMNGDGTSTFVSSPDPGRALITGNPNDVGAFKIPPLWGVSRTAPYFHDNSAKSLAAVMRHYARFFAAVTAASVDGDPAIVLSTQDQADIVAFLSLLD